MLKLWRKSVFSAIFLLLYVFNINIVAVELWLNHICNKSAVLWEHALDTMPFLHFFTISSIFTTALKHVLCDPLRLVTLDPVLWVCVCTTGGRLVLKLSVFDGGYQWKQCLYDLIVKLSKYDNIQVIPL